MDHKIVIVYLNKSYSIDGKVEILLDVCAASLVDYSSCFTPVNKPTTRLVLKALNNGCNINASIR